MCDTPNLQRKDAHGGTTGPIISPHALHLLNVHIMDRSNAMHLWKPTDATMRTLCAEVGNGGRPTLDQELGHSK